MSRARGANAIAAGAFEAVYGTPPADEAEWFRLPFVSSNVGEEQGLIPSDLLGYGREPQDPSDDAAEDAGDIVVPVDARNFGYWLTLYYGEPVSVGAVAASGSFTFSDQPAPNSTITVNGIVWTFVAASPGSNQVLIGANINATLSSLQTALNGSTDPAMTPATYTRVGQVMNILHDTLGLAGNSFTLAAQNASNATRSGLHLTGGAVSHTFTSGAQDLPSMAFGIGHPEVPSYSANFGGRGDALKISMTRKGLLNATLSLVFQGETPASATSPWGDSEDLDELSIDRFVQAQGQIKRDGVELGSIVSADFTYSNNLDKVEVIRPDGRIEDADPAMVAFGGSITTRFKDLDLYDAANDRTPVDLTFGWATSASQSLTFSADRVFLPKAKRPVPGPQGIQATYPWQASGAEAASCVVVLVNDVASYAI